MKCKITVLSLVLTSVLAATAAAPSPAAEYLAQSATGSGQFEFTWVNGVTALRTFAFEAHTSSSGSTSGQAEVKNRAEDLRLHIQIDCLNVIGNIAVMSGTVSSVTGAGNSVGDPVIFAAQNNGEGSGAAPDRITRAFANTGLVCTDITPANIGLYTIWLTVVEEGNVQIH
jgi:hypothetical protein